MNEEVLVRHAQGRPAHLTGASAEYSNDDIEWIARQFEVNGPIIVAPFEGRGNINIHTYQVVAGEEEYLLQQVNSDVFTMPHRVMNSMIASIEAQEQALNDGKGDPSWVPIILIPTKAGKPFLDLSDDKGLSVWRLMIRIPRCTCYKSLSEVHARESQIELAEEVGKGLAIYSDLTSGIDPQLIEGSLPGYRDTALYFSQFHSVMAGNRSLAQAAPYLPDDPIVRSSSASHFLVRIDEAEYLRRKRDADLAPFLDLAVKQEPFAMGLWTALNEGRIRHTLIHGDTKIENFLFCSESGKVKALVDLDTIMPFTWLADWGDMIRSLVNVAGEKERNLAEVRVDRDVYEAVARGFLGAAQEVTGEETDLMVDAVQAITLELGLRFMTDYIRGDTYFRLGPDDPPDLNKVRGMVQLTLYQRLVDFGPEARRRLARYRGR